MSRVLTTILLGTSLAAFPLAAAVGNESGLQRAPGASADAAWSVLPLPPVPHLDTIQWLNSTTERPPRILGPQVDYLSPFLIDPTAPPTQFSATEKPGGLKLR